MAVHNRLLAQDQHTFSQQWLQSQRTFRARSTTLHQAGMLMWAR